MKNLIKIYENLDDETKRMIPLLYMYNEIRNALKNSYKDLRIGIYEEGVIMNTALKCWEKLTLDPSEVIYRLLAILECSDMTVDDFKDLDIDELNELLYDELDESPIDTSENDVTDDSEIENEKDIDELKIDKDNLQALEEFDFKRAKCVFCKDFKNNKYVVIVEDGNEKEAITFNSIKAPLSLLLTHYLFEKDLYYGKISK